MRMGALWVSNLKVEHADGSFMGKEYMLMGALWVGEKDAYQRNYEYHTKYARV